MYDIIIVIGSPKSFSIAIYTRGNFLVMLRVNFGRHEDTTRVSEFKNLIVSSFGP